MDPEVLRLRTEVRELKKAFEALLSVLGLAPMALPSGPATIEKLLEKAEHDLLIAPERLGVVAIREWVQVLLRITPGYLRVVHQVAGLDQPWRPFLQLVDHLIADAPNDTIASAPLVFGILQQGRRNLLAAAHVWALEKGDVSDLPPVVGDILSERIAQAVAVLYGEPRPRTEGVKK